MKLPVPARTQGAVDAVCFGYNSCDYLCLLDQAPPPDGKAPMRQFAREGGGQAATAAVALRRLGFAVSYLGKFGSDEEGGFARASLEREGVSADGCREAPDAGNQVAVIWVDRDRGTRTIAYRRAPGLEIGAGEIDSAYATAGRLLLLDGHHIAASCELAAAARAVGAAVLVDAGKVLPELGALLDLADYVLCDAAFPRAYTGEDNDRRALAELAARHRTPLVAMTLGRRGSLALAGGAWVETPAFAVDVVDTTGAGDVWHAGFAAGVLWGESVEETLRIAAAAAAMKCRRLGGRAGAPTRTELESFLAGEPPVLA